LEGLEIKEVRFSEPLNTELFRLESEFYTAKSFKIQKSFIGKDIIKFVQYGTSKELNEDGVGFPVLRLNEFQSHFISSPSKYCNLIDQETYKSLKLEKDDVLICRTNGNPKLVGKSALVPKDYNFAYASYLFKIRPKKNLINSATLVAFLNSTYGRLEIEKFSMASNQVNFSPAKFREMRIPNLGIMLNDQIEVITYNAFRLLEKSIELYSSAETLLLETLGLQNFAPTQEPTNVKSFSESFAATGRLDAEYYQKKYEDIIQHIETGKHQKISEIVTIKKSIEPGSDVYDDEGSTPFLRVADYNKFGITTPQRNLSDAFVANNFETIEKLKPKSETILFSKDGSVGTAYVLKEDANFITSGAILHLTVKKRKEILPEYLALVFNSILVQQQAERDAGGSIILHWRINEIENVLVPIVDYSIQQQISEKITESFRLKQQSEQLLELAKTAVEKAIEENEVLALAYIENRLAEIGCGPGCDDF
jgi:restriction endonuclease S subunit